MIEELGAQPGLVYCANCDRLEYNNGQSKCGDCGAGDVVMARIPIVASADVFRRVISTYTRRGYAFDGESFSKKGKAGFDLITGLIMLLDPTPF